MGSELKERIGVNNYSQTTLNAKTPGAAGSSVAERVRNKKASDPVCIEMPVRVRGIGGLPIAGTNEVGQDFSEDTRTLIVMATGAVVRMATRVKKGQLLGLRHLRTEQEVSCRVVNVRSSGTPEDYAEVEFTQRATGFWGIHFPNDPAHEPPVVEAAPTPGEVEAERVIFGGGHTERGNVNVSPGTIGTPAASPANEIKAGAKAGAKADVKIRQDRGASIYSDLVKTEPERVAPVETSGFSGVSKSAEGVLTAAERASENNALIQQGQTNLISFPGPATHQEQANILSSQKPDAQRDIPLDFSPVERKHDAPVTTDAEAEHAAIAKAIEDRAAREKVDAEQRELELAEAGRSETQRVAAERAAAEKTAAERLAAAHAEFERIETDKRAEADRKAAELKAAKEAAEKAAAERAAAEKVAAEKAAAEKATAERLVAAQLELERKEAERRAAERIAAAERARLQAEAQRKQAERAATEQMAAEIAARSHATDDVEVTPAPLVKREAGTAPDTRAKGAEPSLKAPETQSKESFAPARTSFGTGIGGTAYGTLEEEIQRDRAALKTSKGNHAYLAGAAAGAVIALVAAGGWWYMHNRSAKSDAGQSGALASLPSSPAANAPASGNFIAPSPASGGSASGGTATSTSAPGSVAEIKANPNPSATSSGNSSVSMSSPSKVQPTAPPVDARKAESKKTTNPRESAALEAAAASELAKKPAVAEAKPILKAKLSAPVLMKRNSPGGDIAAPNIDATPVSGGALELGNVASSSAPVAPAAPPTGGHAVPPRLLKSVAAEYPMLARQRHIEGDVIVQADVDGTGKIVAAKVISGSELLRQAALDAVRQFKYSPAQLDGAPTPSQVLVTVKFRTR